MSASETILREAALRLVAAENAHHLALRAYLDSAPGDTQAQRKEEEAGEELDAAWAALRAALA